MKKRILIIISLLMIIFSITPLTSQTSLPGQSKAINSYLNKKGFRASDYAEMKISDQYYSRSLDMEHIYFQQYFLDIPVENAILNIGYKNEELVHANNTFAVNVDIPSSLISSIIPPENGLRAALRHLGLELLPIPAIKSSNNNLNGISANHLFDKGQVSRQDIKVSLIWIKDGTTLRLCWESVVDNVNSSSEWYHIAIDAVTGEFVKKYNLYVDCGFTSHDLTGGQHEESEHSNSAPAETNTRTPDSTYTVFDFPLESPNHGSRTVTTRPWTNAGLGNEATTLGWHNIGSTQYTVTRGNNVYAYEDQNGNNIAGYSPSSGTLDFNYPLDFNDPPASNQDAAITNLFHACNLIHDILYQYGFDEPAGNFQTNNLGRGGAGNDHVLAEALDGSGTNNANFATPSDGGSGRMQMFLWNSTPPPDFTVNSPGGLNPIIAEESGFSTANKLINVGPVTGDIVLVTDNTGGTSEGCSANPISNGPAISGKIAMIDRGTCSFTEKVKNAQNLGAIAVVVVNNDPISPPIPMGGTDNTITIPAVMISFSDGAAIKTALMSQIVNITLTGFNTQTYDGSYDNGIIAHEYGHGVSNRLTGGPSQAGCLSNFEQMGEGWSDFITLMLTTDWNTATEVDKNGIGTYVIGQSINGLGIRTYPYTTDMGVNPFTYDDIIAAPIFNNRPSPHYVGSVWATMLWDMTWEIINLEPIDPDIYHGQGGNNIALQLVMDGMKLQPCSPGFVDGRDAILLADEILYGGKYKCAIWNAFARRGLGLSASQGLSSDVTDGSEAFDVPEGVGIKKTYSSVLAFEGELIQVVSEAICNCAAESNFQIRDKVREGYAVANILEGSLSGDEVLSAITNLNPRDTVRIKYFIRPDLCGFSPEVQLFADNVGVPAQFTATRNEGRGTQNWLTNSSQVNSPTLSWYAQDYNSQVDLLLTMNSPITISGPSQLSFYHRFQTEGTWDGGVVEISTDGINWTDLGDDFIENGYPSAFAGNGSSALAGRAGFTGDGDVIFGTSGFVRSVVDLCRYIGEDVQVRFRFASDSNTSGTGINGWYIDDIFIKELAGFTHTSTTYQNGTMADSLQKCIFVKELDQDHLFVDALSSGNNFGGDWNNAFYSLQDALKIAECKNIDTIHISEGTYFPFNQRDTSFILRSDLVIMGGFPTGGSLPANRNPLNNPTILSGDIGSVSNTSDNNYHVVYSGSGVTNAVLDGVIIRNGNANGSGDDMEGSAIYNLGELTLIDVNVNNCLGTSKVYNKGSGTVILKGSTILEN